MSPTSARIDRRPAAEVFGIFVDLGFHAFLRQKLLEGLHGGARSRPLSPTHPDNPHTRHAALAHNPDVDAARIRIS